MPVFRLFISLFINFRASTRYVWATYFFWGCGCDSTDVLKKDHKWPQRNPFCLTSPPSANTTSQWCEGRCSLRLSTQPAAVHHSAWSLVKRVSLRGPLAGPLCRWTCYHRWIARGMCQEALDFERSNGGERAESKCRKDKYHHLWYGPGPPAEFMRVSMRRLSHWCGQHLLQRLQALGAQEMQWT